MNGKKQFRLATSLRRGLKQMIMNEANLEFFFCSYPVFINVCIRADKETKNKYLSSDYGDKKLCLDKVVMRILQCGFDKKLLARYGIIDWEFVVTKNQDYLDEGKGMATRGEQYEAMNRLKERNNVYV
tara:strand:- start:96 stop:479 length:384 start_codon:yes stop_codon:yes gene_type:complete